MDTQAGSRVEWLEGTVTSLVTKDKEFSNGRLGKLWILMLDESPDKKVSGFGEPPQVLREAAEGKHRVRVGYARNGAYKNYADEVSLAPGLVPVRVEKVMDGDKQADLIALLTSARDAFVQVYGREPKTDGEFAVCNTAFIWLKNGG